MPPARSARPETDPPPAPGPTAAHRVLLIQDAPDETAEVQAALSDLGSAVRVLRADTLPAIEAALRARDWDLAVVVGPLATLGFDAVMARLVQHGPELPVVVTTDVDDRAFAHHAAASGAREVVDAADGPAIRRALHDALFGASPIGDDIDALEARLAGAGAHVRTLARVAASLRRATDAREALEAVAEGLGSGLGLPYLETWQPGEGRAVDGPFFAREGAFAALRESLSAAPAIGRAGLVRNVLTSRRPQTIPDLHAGDAAGFRRADEALALGLHAVHAAPVIADGRALGALLAYGDAERRLGPDDVTTVDLAAELLGSTLARLATHAAAQRELLRVSALLDHVDDGIMACDAEGRVTLVNATMESLCGPVAVGSVPAAWSETHLMLADDGAPLPFERIPMIRALRGETLRDEQFLVEAPTGRRRVVRASATPILDADGERAGAVVALRNVTERVAAEAAAATAAEHTLRAYTLLLDDVSDLARSVAEADALPEVWSGILQFAHHTLGADELVVVETPGEAGGPQGDGHQGDGATTLYAARYVPGVGPQELDAHGTRSSAELERAIRERTVVLAQRSAQAGSRAAVAMVQGGASLGGFEIRADRPAAFAEHTTVALTMVANLAAISLDHARLVEGERHARAAAEHAARQLRQIFDVSPAAVSITSLVDDRIIDVNPAMVALLGYARDELIGARAIDLGIWPNPDDRAALAAAARAGEAVRGAEVRLRHRDGSVRTTLLSADAADLRGEATMLALMVDVTERIAQEGRVRDLAHFRESLMAFIAETLEGGFDTAFYGRLLESAVEATPHAQAGSLLVRDAGGDAYRFVATVGYDLAGLQSVVFDDREIGMAHVEERATTNDTLPSVNGDEQRAHTLRRFGRLDDIRSTLSVPIHLEGRREASLSLDNFERSGAFDDLSMQLAEAFAAQVAALIKRRKLEHDLEHLAYHDTLTSLPNRALFRDRMEQAISRALRTQSRGAALFLDLDNLKATNDALGHAIGDALLVSVAQRLRDSVRAVDTVARIGGDEFTMVLQDAGSDEDVAGVAEKILRALHEPFLLGRNEVHVTASIGVTLFPDDATDADMLIAHGDTAMYQAKAQGKDCYRFFTPEMNALLLERADLEAHLRKALERDELELHYQPRVSLRDGAITSVEALARWPHPERGWIAPSVFIPIAEEAGLIRAVSLHLLDLACRQAKAWERAGTPSIVAVNFSVRQLQERNLVATVRGALERADLDARSLEIELTESAIMHNVAENVVKLDELRALGVSISIDDFGTAYSSLNYLKRLPATALKIDRSFIRDIRDLSEGAEGTHDAAIVRAIVALATALDVRVIAEGVETVEQLAFLRAVGCEEAQGFLFARPVPPEELSDLMRAGRVDLSGVRNGAGSGVAGPSAEA